MWASCGSLRLMCIATPFDLTVRNLKVWIAFSKNPIRVGQITCAHCQIQRGNTLSPRSKGNATPFHKPFISLSFIYFTLQPFQVVTVSGLERVLGLVCRNERNRNRIHREAVCASLRPSLRCGGLRIVWSCASLQSDCPPLLIRIHIVFFATSTRRMPEFS